MSILQDLDPKYAKIQTQSSFAGWKSITWILSVLLILLWASWLVFTLQFDKSAPENKPTGNALQDQGGISTEATKAPGIDGSRTTSTSPVNILQANSGAGSAIIQETREVTPTELGKIQEPVYLASIAPETKKLTNSDQMTKVDTRDQSDRQQTRRSTGHTTDRKPSNLANKAYADKNSQPSAKKAAERDIDIITAIVR
ncbi:MAG: hypothetical protein H6R13_1058 [Proteobacteria bacterium]|nr:hypothetical protein [Pseudomonadota bacterium]